MTPVFLDTVGLIALYDVDDQWHMAAVPIYKQLVRSAQRAVTTSLVLYECGNAASRGPHRPAVDELRQLMAESGDLIEPTPEEIENAWANYTRGVAGSAVSWITSVS